MIRTGILSGRLLVYPSDHDVDDRLCAMMYGTRPDYHWIDRIEKHRGIVYVTCRCGYKQSGPRYEMSAARFDCHWNGRKPPPLPRRPPAPKHEPAEAPSVRVSVTEFGAALLPWDVELGLALGEMFARHKPAMPAARHGLELACPWELEYEAAGLLTYDAE